MIRTEWGLIGLTILIPTLASAEVMDKEPTLPELWLVGSLWGLAGFVAWRRHTILGAVMTLLALPLVLGFHWELSDPYVGPDIRREAGQGYVAQAYLSMALCLALHLLGAANQFRRTRRPTGSRETHVG